MWTFKENKNYERESENRHTTPISKNRRLVNGRIDFFYKSTKIIHKDDNSPKRDVSNKQETPSKLQDSKKKQKTLSPWLVKENKSTSGIFDKTSSFRPRRRKASNPKKSARTWDPDFRGATVWFNRGSEDDNQLVITSSFSNTRQKKDTKSKKKRQLFSLMEPRSSSENDECVEITAQLPESNGKMCASCNTTTTPLWRDAEDGTPLCNACGIRYRKYRIRCCYCWHIPKKDCKTYQICPLCGSDLKFSCYRKI